MGFFFLPRHQPSTATPPATIPCEFTSLAQYTPWLVELASGHGIGRAKWAPVAAVCVFAWRVARVRVWAWTWSRRGEQPQTTQSPFSPFLKAEVGGGGCCARANKGT
jgi:hypothetical protein